MSRVLHCVNSLGVGGVETLVLQELSRLAARSQTHEFALCAFRGGPLEDEGLPPLRNAGVPCHVLGRSARFSLDFCSRLIAIADEYNPDIIHAHNPGASMWTRTLLGGRRHRQCVVHCHGVGVFKRWRNRFIEQRLLNRAARFIFNSHSTRAVWEKFLDVGDRGRVIHNGLPVDNRPEYVAPEDLPREPFTLITVCRIMPIKSLGTQFDAVKILRDRGDRDIRLIVVGDGPARAECEAYVRTLGLDDVVRFEGFVADPRSYHAKAHVYLGTSINETFSITLAEAMLDRMICVAARVGGPSEIIEHETSGFLVPCEKPLPDDFRRTMPPVVYDHVARELREPRAVDPVDLADAIEHVRRHFNELAPMRRAARERIASHFSMDAHCDALNAIYDELAPAPREVVA
jgi:glycosyltransferase involved in cell wall biosynthesis